jgi:hypothetical protein
MRESGIRKQRNLRLSSMSHQAPPSVVNEWVNLKINNIKNTCELYYLILNWIG